MTLPPFPFPLYLPPCEEYKLSPVFILYCGWKYDRSGYFVIGDDQCDAVVKWCPNICTITAFSDTYSIAADVLW